MRMKRNIITLSMNSVGIFPSMDSYIRLVTSYLIEYSEDWSSGRSYIDSRIIATIQEDKQTAA